MAINTKTRGFTINDIDPELPNGGERVSQVDDFIRQDRQWIIECLKNISCYPNSPNLIIPRWSTANRPNTSIIKEGVMGFNTDTKKFDYYTGNSWVSLEYAADSSTSCSGNSATATKATKDGSGNVITTTYLKLSDVTNAKGKVPRFLSNGHLQFWDGSEFWVE